MHNIMHDVHEYFMIVIGVTIKLNDYHLMLMNLAIDVILCVDV